MMIVIVNTLNSIPVPKPQKNVLTGFERCFISSSYRPAIFS